MHFFFRLVYITSFSLVRNETMNMVFCKSYYKIRSSNQDEYICILNNTVREKNKVLGSSASDDSW